MIDHALYFLFHFMFGVIYVPTPSLLTSNTYYRAPYTVEVTVFCSTLR